MGPVARMVAPAAPYTAATSRDEARRCRSNLRKRLEIRSIFSWWIRTTLSLLSISRPRNIPVLYGLRAFSAFPTHPSAVSRLNHLVLLLALPFRGRA